MLIENEPCKGSIKFFEPSNELEEVFRCITYLDRSLYPGFDGICAINYAKNLLKL